MTNQSAKQTETVHPLRSAVESAKAALALANEAFSALPEGEDEAAGQRVSEAENLLRAAQLALVGSSCPRSWALREDGYEYETIVATSSDAALEIARDNVDRANYSDAVGTIWIDVRVDCEESGEGDSDSVTLDADVPPCSDDSDGHEFKQSYDLFGGSEKNPGVWGHGGGVVIHEVCLHCGCKRVTDTWAQRRDTGEQGLKSVSYEEEAFSREELIAAGLVEEEAEA